MFNFNNKKNIPFNLINIVSDYRDLYFDEYPILFTGCNKYGSRLIASIIEEDADNEVNYYLYTFISQEQYVAFMNNKVSYRDIISKAEDIFVLKKFFDNSKEPYVFCIEQKEIPNDYLPTEDSFYEDESLENSFQYSVSLKGKDADFNQADPKEVNIINDKFTSLFKKAANFFPSLKDIKILQQAFSPGSFKLNYNIELTDKQMLIPFAQDDIKNQMSNYIEYCINNLPEEVEQIMGENLNETIFQKKFGKYQKSNEEIKKNLLSLIETIKEITDIDAKSFKRIELYNSWNNKKHIKESKNLETERILATLEQKNLEVFEKTIEKINKSLGKEPIYDTEVKNYSILVYHLNVRTKKGTATILMANSDKQHCNPSIFIKCDKPIENSSLTHSLDKGEYINIKGKAKRYENRFTHIEIVDF